MANDSTPSLTHFDAHGRAHMVDITEKNATQRDATAIGSLRLASSTLQTILGHSAAKGDVLAVARIAGITAAKKTSDLIPLCHPIALSHVSIKFGYASGSDQGAGVTTLWVRASVRCRNATGVEMEALTAAQIAALTVYDMCKAIDRAMLLSTTFLAVKSGGRSGMWTHPEIRELSPPDATLWV